MCWTFVERARERETVRHLERSIETLFRGGDKIALFKDIRTLIPNATIIRVHQNSKKFSKSHGLLIYLVPTWVQTISAKKEIFFAFSSLGHRFEKNGPCSRENEVKYQKNVKWPKSNFRGPILVPNAAFGG